jgi:hypothetical protein
VPKVKKLMVSDPIWNLPESFKDAVAALNNLELTFYNIALSEDHLEEKEFRKSLIWVTFDEYDPAS